MADCFLLRISATFLFAEITTDSGLEEAIAALEARMLREVLAEAGGNQSEAIRRLGISRPGLIKKMARLGLR